jgi:hypothetical protein
MREESVSGTCLSEYVSGLPITIPPYHPEFGYLRPSPRVCRSIRLALVSAAIGMLVGAVAILSLLDKRLAQTSASDQTSAFARGDQNDADVDKFPISANYNGASSEGVVLSLPEDCRESARSFFDRSCRFVRKHKLSGARSTSRLGTAGIGRNGPAGGALEQEASAVDVGSIRANAGQREEAAATSTHVPVPAEKSTKIVRARQHPRVPNEGGVNAFASASTSVEGHQYQNMPRSDLPFNAATGGRTW